MSPERTEVLFSTSVVDPLNLSRGKFEGHGAKVIAHALLLAAGGDYNHILVNTPSQKDLARVDGVLLRKTLEDVVERAWGALEYWGQRSVCLGCNALVSVSGGYCFRKWGLRTCCLWNFRSSGCCR